MLREGVHMKRQLVLAALTLLAVGAQTAARADDAWFNKYDHNHDGHWNYGEFKKAHYDYWKHHHDEKRWSDKELRAQWAQWDAEHHGYVTPEQVREFHHWN
jgi:hypothetical protein